MARGEQLARQWKLIQQISSSLHGKTVAELAENLECNQRTAYRDLQALQDAGFPLVDEKIDGKKRWRVINNSKSTTPIPFTLAELMALYFSTGVLRGLSDTVFYESLDTLLQKIKSTLPPDSIRYLQTLQETITVGKKPYKNYSKYREMLARINEAAINRKSVQIVYFTMSRKKKTRRTIDPYRIWFFNGTFYLVGYCHMRGEIRTFALDRIKMLTVTDESFSVQKDFNFDELMRSGFGVIRGVPEKVLIRFHSSIAEYIREKIWHDSQVIYPQDDGSIIYEAHVAINWELKLWILRWGSGVEVLEPESLRADINAEARKMVEIYNPGKRAIDKTIIKVGS